MTALGEIGTTHFLRDEISRGHAVSSARAGDRHRGRRGGRRLGVGVATWRAALRSSRDWDEAARYNEEARRLNPPDRAAKLVLNTATDAQIAAARGDTEKAAQLVRQVLAESRPRTGDGVGRARGARADRGRRGPTSEAATHFEAALQTIEKTRSALLKADYRVSFLTRVISFYRGYVDFLMATGQIERALEMADSSRGRVLAERPRRRGADHAAPRRHSASAPTRAIRCSSSIGSRRNDRWRGWSPAAASAVFRCRPATRSSRWSRSTTRRCTTHPPIRWRRLTGPAINSTRASSRRWPPLFPAMPGW